MGEYARSFPWLDLGLILLCWILFLLLLFYVWPSGVLFGEEAVGTMAYAWIHQIPNMMSGPHIRLFGWDIPAMFDMLHGPWSIYGLTPFVAVQGCTLLALRSYSAFMFFFALWGTWRLARLLNGSRYTAFLSTMLLAICPMMVITRSKLVTAPDVAASVWTICFAVLFARTRKQFYAYAACASFFIGLCSRSWVAGLGVGLALFMALTWRQVISLLPESKAAKTKLVAGCLACAILILLPIIIYNASEGWPVARFYIHHLVKRASWCSNFSGTCSNLDYLENLKVSFLQLRKISDGAGVMMTEPWHWLYVLPLLFSFFYAVREAWHRRTLWSASAMLWVVAIGYVMSSAVSPTEQFSIHFAPLVPILCVLAVLWLDAVQSSLWYRAAILMMSLICAVQFAADFRLLESKNINYDFAQSSLLIKVSRWVGRHSRTPIISLYIPLTFAIPYFSQNQARLIYSSPYGEPNPIPWEDWLRRRDRPYLILRNGRTTERRLKSQADKLGVHLILVKVFHDSSAQSALDVYRAM